MEINFLYHELPGTMGCVIDGSIIWKWIPDLYGVMIYSEFLLYEDFALRNFALTDFTTT
jgi:hypothetical protein